ncbi:site-specific integrase [Cupriavidus pinatubonensis]|uniref:site-specific integrase n=1 Tax=Cupriavidus pinatubonensis TaxID=248026 RepID=UPI0036123B1D
MASIWKRGDYWRVAIRRRGFPPQARTFDTKVEAEAWAREAEAEMDRGAFVDRREAERNTLGDLLLRYSEEVSPDKKGGEQEILRIRKLRSDPIAQFKISALTGKVLASYRDRRLKGDGKRQPVTGSTVNRELTLLSHVLNVAAKEWGVHLPVNPVSAIRRPRESRGRTRRLSPTEEARLLSELAASPRSEHGYYDKGGSRNASILPMTILALETAMRRGELLSIRWSDVFLEDRFLRLHDSKNGEPRDVPLSTRAVNTLTPLAKLASSGSERVFPTTADAVKKAFTRACERAGIENLRFHDLRHEGTSRIAERLDNVLELSAITGHKTLQMLKRYYHPRAKDLALKLG